MEDGVGSGVEHGAPVWVDGIEEDVLDDHGVLIAGIEFAAALGLTDADPVGGTLVHATNELSRSCRLGRNALGAHRRPRCGRRTETPGPAADSGDRLRSPRPGLPTLRSGVNGGHLSERSRGSGEERKWGHYYGSGPRGARATGLTRKAPASRRGTGEGSCCESGRPQPALRARRWHRLRW